MEEEQADVTAEQTTERSSEQTVTGGAELLRAYCSKGFESDIDAAAISLGRQTEELRAMLDGDAEVDDDLEMKMRGIAQERGFQL